MKNEVYFANCRIYIIWIYFRYLTNCKSKSEKIVIKAKYIFSEMIE